MNIVIGLCHNVPHWPNPFTQKDYKISKIELKIPVSRPDILITNNKTNHSILFECKSSGNYLKEIQMQKYDRMRKNPSALIESGKIPIIHKDQFKIDAAYSSFENLATNELIIKYGMICLHVERLPNFKIKSIWKTNGTFIKKNLEEIFPIDTYLTEPPTFLYPFDENDIEMFTKEILNQLQRFGYNNKPFKTTQLLERCHSLWKFIDDKKKFETKATGILLDLQKKGLKNYLKQDKQTGDWSVSIKPDSRSYQTFLKRCNEIIKILDYKSYQELLKTDFGDSYVEGL